MGPFSLAVQAAATESTSNNVRLSQIFLDLPRPDIIHPSQVFAIQWRVGLINQNKHVQWLRIRYESG